MAFDLEEFARQKHAEASGTDPQPLTLSGKKDYAESETSRIRRNYGHALEAVRQGSPGAVGMIDNARKEMDQVGIIDEEVQRKQDQVNANIEQLYNGSPNPLSTMLNKAQKSEMNIILGAQDQYYKRKQDFFPSEENAQQLADHTRKRASENQWQADTDPMDYQFDEGYRNVANKAAGFLGGVAPLAAASYLGSRAIGPALGLPGIWGTGLSAADEVSYAAINSFPKVVAQDMIIDSAIGALDQTTNVEESMIAGLASNIFFRGAGHALQKNPDTPVPAMRKVFAQIEDAEKKYGNPFRLTKPSTWNTRGQKLHFDAPFRERTKAAESLFNAKASADPWRNIIAMQEEDQSGFFANMIKDVLIPGSPKVRAGMLEGLDDDFTNKYLQISKKNMDARPADSVSMHPKEIKDLKKTFSANYGAESVTGDPAVRKRLAAITSQLKATAVREPDVIVPAHNGVPERIRKGKIIDAKITPDFYESELINLNAAIKSAEKGTSTYNALFALRNNMQRKAEAAYPGLVDQHKLGQNQYALHSWMKDITDPTSKLVDKERAAKWMYDDSRKDLPGIPINVGLAGESIPLTKAIGDMANVLDRKKISQSTLHDNGVVNTAVDESRWMKTKTGGMGLITGMGNTLYEDLGNIYPRFNLYDTRIGASPTQINRVKTLIGSPVGIKAMANTDDQQAEQDIESMIETQRRLDEVRKKYAK